MDESVKKMQPDARRYVKGDMVRIRQANPVGHCRTPYYFRGVVGVIERYCGAFPNPEELAYGRSGLPAVHLYRVRAKQIDTWHNYSGSPLDSIEVEVFEHWIESVDVQNPK